MKRKKYTYLKFIDSISPEAETFNPVPINREDKRQHHKGLNPKLWNGAKKDYYDNPALPWKCDRCDARFKYKQQVKDHKLEAHAY